MKASPGPDSTTSDTGTSMLWAIKPSTAKTENPAYIQVNTLVNDTKTASVWQLFLYCNRKQCCLLEKLYKFEKNILVSK